MKVAFCLVGIVGSVQGKYGLDGTANSTKGTPVDFRIGHHFHKKHIFQKILLNDYQTYFDPSLNN